MENVQHNACCKLSCCFVVMHKLWRVINTMHRKHDSSSTTNTSPMITDNTPTRPAVNTTFTEVDIVRAKSPPNGKVETACALMAMPPESSGSAARAHDTAHATLTDDTAHATLTDVDIDTSQVNVPKRSQRAETLRSIKHALAEHKKTVVDVPSTSQDSTRVTNVAPRPRDKDNSRRIFEFDCPPLPVKIKGRKVSVAHKEPAPHAKTLFADLADFKGIVSLAGGRSHVKKSFLVGVETNASRRITIISKEELQRHGKSKQFPLQHVRYHMNYTEDLNESPGHKLKKKTQCAETNEAPSRQ